MAKFGLVVVKIPEMKGATTTLVPAGTVFAVGTGSAIRLTKELEFILPDVVEIVLTDITLN